MIYTQTHVDTSHLEREAILLWHQKPLWNRKHQHLTSRALTINTVWWYNMTTSGFWLFLLNDHKKKNNTTGCHLISSINRRVLKLNFLNTLQIQIFIFIFFFFFNTMLCILVFTSYSLSGASNRLNTQATFFQKLPVSAVP